MLSKYRGHGQKMYSVNLDSFHIVLKEFLSVNIVLEPLHLNLFGIKSKKCTSTVGYRLYAVLSSSLWTTIVCEACSHNAYHFLWLYLSPKSPSFPTGILLIFLLYLSISSSHPLGTQRLVLCHFLFFSFSCLAISHLVHLFLCLIPSCIKQY